MLIDDAVLEGIEENIELAPLHNPHNLKAIAAVQEVLGRNVPQAAVFDTAFHHTLPEQAFLYAIPTRSTGVTGSGATASTALPTGTWPTATASSPAVPASSCGSSHCILERLLGLRHRVGALRGYLHGLPPRLEGLVMGTRSGDLDPALLDFLSHKEGLSIRDIDMLLNKQSGLLGLSGLTHEMKELLAEESETGDRRARVAIDLFCYRARKYVGAYFAAMCGADAIVFTGGIGENSPEIRARIVGGLDRLGVHLDAEANTRTTGGAEGRITAEGAQLEVWVIPTNEELLIARDTARLVLGLEPGTDRRSGL